MKVRRSGLGFTFGIHALHATTPGPPKCTVALRLDNGGSSKDIHCRSREVTDVGRDSSCIEPDWQELKSSLSPAI